MMMMMMMMKIKSLAFYVLLFSCLCAIFEQQKWYALARQKREHHLSKYIEQKQVRQIEFLRLMVYYVGWEL